MWTQKFKNGDKKFGTNNEYNLLLMKETLGFEP